MAYWMAYKNNHGNYRHYLCSDCHRPAPVNGENTSILSDTCPKCGVPMSFVGIIPEAPYIRI